jgi:hypothetical protein
MTNYSVLKNGKVVKSSNTHVFGYFQDLLKDYDFVSVNHEKGEYLFNHKRQDNVTLRIDTLIWQWQEKLGLPLLKS